MEDYIRPHVFVALRLPSGLHKVAQLKPNTTVSLGKYGSFATNDILGRPFYLTYEIVDAGADSKRTKLRVVSTTELYEQDEIPEADLSGDQPDRVSKEDVTDGGKGQFEILDQNGKVLMRTNRNILDDNAAQKLTMAEIEELKRAESASGRDIIAKIMESHSQLDKKTAFSLAKYTTRKANKYLRRFVPVPLDVPFLARWWLYEKEPAKVMDIREEMLSLIGSWSNVHYTDPARLSGNPSVQPDISSGRWLIVDETGGLLVAAVAEKLGILHPTEAEETVEERSQDSRAQALPGQDNAAQTIPDPTSSTVGENILPPAKAKTETSATNGVKVENAATSSATPNVPRPVPASVLAQESHMSATDNTITVVHTNAQPNLSMLSYYNYDQTNSQPSHPLHRHLKTVSWLQLLHPEEDPTYEQPEVVGKEELESWKSAKRGAYYRKRRRWERVKSVIDQTRNGGFDGLIVASSMTPASIVHQLVPLLRGGAPTVIYSAHIEPLAELVDAYSAARKTAFLNEQVSPESLPNDDFPVNPTLLLSPTVYTARVRPWQVLPGRTHPLMTGIGGPEGYVFTATRVLPIEGERVEARGSFLKKRKTTHKADIASPAAQEPQE